MRFLVGDVFEQVATLEDDSVDLVFSSPPFLALRSYLPADHPDKAKEIGSEANPAAFLDALLDVVEACDRVLAPHGSLCFELGDTYAGSGGAGGGYGKGGLRDGQAKFAGSALKDRKNKVLREDGNRLQQGAGWPLDKSLTGIPTLFAWSLAYGRNLLRPERETPRWRVRNLVPWCRPNPPVGALGDKWRPATSYVTVACKSRTRWFDLDAVRTEVPRTDNERTTSTQYTAPGQPERRTRASDENGARLYANVNGAPPLDYLVLPTAPYTGAHYATFPPGLVTPFVESMCPREVCRECGEPRRRIVETTQLDTGRTTNGSKPRDRAESFAGTTYDKRTVASTETLGWTDCGCHIIGCTASGDDQCECVTAKYRQGVVLDPFAGSGTTLMVAGGHGRDAIGIDLDERNADLARERCGLFLTVEGGL